MSVRLAAIVAAAALVPAALGMSPIPGPERIVSLVPAATEALFAMGLGSRVVGVSSYDSWPPEVERLPRVGALIDPDLEGILALRPDLVVVDPAHVNLVRQLGAAGIGSIPYATVDLAGVLAQIRSLGAAIGESAAGDALAARLEEQLAEVRDLVAELPRRDVLLVFGRRPGAFAELWVNGGVGFLHDIVEVAGGRNLFADVDRASFKSGLESLLSRVPEVVVEVRGDVESADDLAAVAREWRSLPGFSAVEVVVLDVRRSLVPGPRLAEVARDLAARLHPGVGQDVSALL